MAEYYKSAAEQAVRQGKTDRAVQFYQRYLKIVPDNEAILDRIAALTTTPTATPRQQATATPPPLPTATPTATLIRQATPIAGQEYHDPVSGIDFVWIPEGCFLMGQTETEKQTIIQERGEGAYKNYYQDELPQHEVCLDGFWMGKTEMTQAQWQQVMGSNPSRFEGDSRPVEQVSWNDAQKYLKKLNTQAGQEIYRLPTEAEWEYAARAGTTTPFYFGETISTDQANYDGDYVYGSGKKGVDRGQTTEVGSFPANAWGLYDIHGNVWEWCQDWYGSDYYATSPKDNPQGPDTWEYRVLRGGSWDDDPHGCRSAYRSRGVPGYRGDYVGFRVVAGVVAWTP
jgi:formylglycine-generating enzyme required for sulfatase activity